MTAVVETVKRIFESKSKGLGLVAIADLLNGQCIPSPRRGRWRNRDNRWTGSTIKGIIENPVYVGDRVYNRLTFSKFAAGFDGFCDGTKRANKMQEWVTWPNAHAAIVSRETFEMANAVVERHLSRPNHHYYRSTYLLTGLIKCLECSYSFQGFTHKKTGNRYYVDGGYINKGETVCRWFSVRQDKTEKFILESIRDTFLVGGMERRVKESIQRITKSFPNELIDQHASLAKTLKEVKLKIQNLIGFAERGIQLDSIALRIEELEKQQRSLEQNRDTLERTHLLLDSNQEEIQRQVTDFLSDFDKGFDEMSLPNKKAALRRFVEIIVVDRKERKVRCYLKGLPSLGPVGSVEAGTRSVLSSIGSLKPNLRHPVGDFVITELDLA